MMTMSRALALAAAAWGMLAASGAAAQGSGAAPDGAALWAERCAGCHDRVAMDNRAPPRITLAPRPASDIIQALTTGPMVPMAQGLSKDQIAAIASYITGKAAGPAGPPVADANPCPRSPAIDLADAPWNGWGRDPDNTRYQPAPGFAAADVGRLKLKWAFSYAGGTATQPVLVGGRVFVGVGSHLYSLDARTGCVHWRRDEAAGLRGALTIGRLGARTVAFYGDLSQVVHAIDAMTGKPIWQVKVEDHPRALLTGSPVLWRGRLYVPVSSLEETVSLDSKYGCCTFRGSVVALDAASGKRLWKTYTIDQPARPTKKNTAGVQMYGPAGAAIWSAPTIDPKRGALYVATGDSYTDAPAPRSDAILALDLVTGKIRWASQATANDNYLVNCTGQKDQPVACPDAVGPDFDFGSPPILRTLKNGRQVLLAGQKSGTAYGLDPDHGGKVIWSRKLGAGSALGGVEWGMASAPGVLYVPIADTASPPDQRKPGLSAVDIADGHVIWSAPSPAPDCASGVVANLAGVCVNGYSAAISAAPGLVFAGSMDGHLRAYRASDGRILWDHAGAGVAFTPVNGPAVKGGGYNGSGPALGHGMLIEHLGYGAFNASASGLLLAFSVDGK
jgi:polyvinyl alcohol dehydrogenase (cytochrome)